MLHLAIFIMLWDQKKLLGNVILAETWNLSTQFLGPSLLQCVVILDEVVHPLALALVLFKGYFVDQMR